MCEFCKKYNLTRGANYRWTELVISILFVMLIAGMVIWLFSAITANAMVYSYQLEHSGNSCNSGFQRYDTLGTALGTSSEMYLGIKIGSPTWWVNDSFEVNGTPLEIYTTDGTKVGGMSYAMQANTEYVLVNTSTGWNNGEEYILHSLMGNTYTQCFESDASTSKIYYIMADSFEDAVGQDHWLTMEAPLQDSLVTPSGWNWVISEYKLKA